MSQTTHHIVSVTEVNTDAETGAIVTTIELQKRVFFGANADELIERVNKQPRRRRSKGGKDASK